MTRPIKSTRSKKKNSTSTTYHRRVIRSENIGRIEKKYNVDLGVRSDMKVSTFLKKKGFGNLSKIIDHK